MSANTIRINNRPGFHILISLIEIWTPADPKKPNGSDKGDRIYITEVEEVEIDESYNKLIGTASVRFPRGTILRKTVTTLPEDFNKVTAAYTNAGVIEETRISTEAATPTTFKVGQRIRIYLGYTTKPEIAALGKTNNAGKSIYSDANVLTTYRDAFGMEMSKAINGRKKHTNLMFDGYITKISLDTPIELECENLASVLKTISCDGSKLKKCEVKHLLGETKGGLNLLKDTGLILHPATAKMEFDLGGVELPTDWTVADVLTAWSKHGINCYVSEYEGTPAIQVARIYFSNPGPDSIVNQTLVSEPVPIYFDYHVADNGLSLTSTDQKFLAVEATGFDEDDKPFKITVIRNSAYDPAKPDSNSNAKYRFVNESKLSKKAIKAGKRYVSSSTKDRVDMDLYTKIGFISKTIPVSRQKLAEEAWKYLEGYNMTGIEGDLTLFGDLHLRTAQKVRLYDSRYPGKEGVYLVEEVHTTFGTKGFRQTIKLPYCIWREGMNTQNIEE